MRALGALASLGLLLGASPAFAGATYSVTDSSSTFQSISASGTPITFSNSDDGSASVNLPFDFPIYLGSISSGLVYPQTNGMLALESVNTEYANDTLPGAIVQATLAPFWDDLEVGSGTAYSLASGVAPNRTLTIEWNSFNILSTASVLTFQVVLHENGNVEFKYGPNSGTGGSATIGIQGQNGFDGNMYTCGSACTFLDIPPGTVITFTRMSGPPPMGIDLSVTNGGPVPSTAAPNTSINIPWTVAATGNGNAGPFSVGLMVADTMPAQMNGTVVLSETITSLGGSDTRSGTFNFIVPPQFEGFTIYSAIVVDTTDAVVETNEQNNGRELGPTSVSGGMMPSITVTTNAVPDGMVGASYAFQLQQTGATSAEWTIESGSLPAGLSMDLGGFISGAPIESGQFPFRVQAWQGGFTPGTANLLLTISPGMGQPLAVLNPNPSAGEVGAAYSYAFQAQGGMPPYAWSSSGALPPGLVLLSSGTLSGSPTTAGEFTFTLNVLDNNEDEAAANVTVTIREQGVNPTPLSVTVGDTMSFRIGAAANVPLTATGGTPPYSWAAAGLPAGLMVQGSAIVGTGTSSTTAQVMLTVTDGDMNQASKVVAVTVSATGGNNNNNNNNSSGGGRRGGGGTSRSNGGCMCVTTPATSPSGLLGLLLVGGVLVAIGRKRR